MSQALGEAIRFARAALAEKYDLRLLEVAPGQWEMVGCSEAAEAYNTLAAAHYACIKLGEG